METAEEARRVLVEIVEPKEQVYQVVGMRKRGSAVRLSLGSGDAAKSVMALMESCSGPG